MKAIKGLLLVLGSMIFIGAVYFGSVLLGWFIALSAIVALVLTTLFFAGWYVFGALKYWLNKKGK